METSNIDDGQIALGLQGAQGFDVRDLNRMEYFRDFNADLSGYVKKDVLWWYGAYRYTQTSQRYPNLIDEAQKSWNPVYTTKWTYNLNQRQKLIGYHQYTNKRQPDYLFGSTTILKADALPDSYFPVRVLKGEYNASIGQTVYSVPVTLTDPGPDGRLGSGDDGATLTGDNLSAQALAAGVVNFTRNLENADSDYYTWEITANKRQTGRWSVLASFAQTWSRDSALGAGNSYTPNVFINAQNGVEKFKTWQAKVSGTLPLDLRVIPILRHQSGAGSHRANASRPLLEARRDVGL